MNIEHIILVGKPEGNRPLGRSWCVRSVILQWVSKKQAGEGVNWIHLP